MTERAARTAAPTVLALLLVVGALMTRVEVPLASVAAAVGATAGALLAWRRLTGWPLVAALVVPASVVVLLGHDQAANLAWMGLCVLAAWAALGAATPGALVAYALLCTAPVVEFVLDPAEAGWFAWVMGTTFTTVACLFARRLRETNLRLEEAQDELATRSRAEERARIAGEVHDVIGHALTVSLLHIGSARLALDDDLDEARAALAEAERLARGSLEEVRATVGLMRSDDPTTAAPLPGAADVGDLVDSYRRAGAAVSLSVSGDLAVLGAARGLAAYRIVQESLTNATRHAAGQPVSVEILVGGREAVVRVLNSASDTAVAPAVPGSGLLGMRERAEAVGGRLRVGAADPGWRVEAVLPS